MSKNRKQKARSTYANSHASIESRPNFNAQIGGFTYTARREDDFDAAVFTDSSNTTTMSVLVVSRRFVCRVVRRVRSSDSSTSTSPAAATRQRSQASPDLAASERMLIPR